MDTASGRIGPMASLDKIMIPASAAPKITALVDKLNKEKGVLIKKEAKTKVEPGQTQGV